MGIPGGDLLLELVMMMKLSLFCRTFGNGKIFPAVESSSDYEQN